MKFTELQNILYNSFGIEKLVDIARELDVTPQVVNNWKSNNNVPHKNVIQIIESYGKPHYIKIDLEEYDETIYAEESLHRLVEIYYLLGLKEESKKYAVLLGYNYQSSQWYDL